MKKNLDKKNIIIGVLVIALILVLWALFSSQITGKSVKTTTKPQCNDGTDNDGDGYCDYSGCYIGKGSARKYLPKDSDCLSSVDNKEAPDCIQSTEICDNKDNDCDGSIDENLVQRCGITDIGACEYGSQSCSAGQWGGCIGNINPIPEICEGTIDDDCDGVLNNNCSCINGRIKSCGISNTGECRYGNSTCSNGQWEGCIGNINPIPEICDNKDNDCDGSTDEVLPTICSSSSVCGISGWTGNTYCTNGNVYKSWTNYQCNNAGTCLSSCSSQNSSILYQSCNGTGCSNGQCINSDSCSDSDGGLNIFTKGIASGYRFGNFYSNEDFCNKNLTLIEYYCSGTRAYNSSLSCLGNSTSYCYQGKCS